MTERRAPATDMRWIPNYVKAFGAVRGLSLFLRVARLDRADASEPAPVALPGIGTVWLRAAVRDHAIFQQVWVKGEYDLSRAAPRHVPSLMRAYTAALDAGRQPLILDAGAHVGMSVLWWKHVFPRARIVAVEPSAANAALLQRNTAGLPDVTILRAGLSGTMGSLRIPSSERGGSDVRLDADGPGDEVPAVTVGHIMEQAGADDLLFAKIDIEGAEAGVFAGDLAWLDRTRGLAIEIHDWLYPGEGTSRSLFAAIGARHFDVLTSGENLLLFRAADPSATAVVPG